MVLSKGISAGVNDDVYDYDFPPSLQVIILLNGNL